jgi:hypothetical protein
MTPYLNLFSREGRRNFRHSLSYCWRTRWLWGNAFRDTLFFWF